MGCYQALTDRNESKREEKKKERKLRNMTITTDFADFYFLVKRV